MPAAYPVESLFESRGEDPLHDMMTVLAILLVPLNFSQPLYSSPSLSCIDLDALQPLGT